MYNHWKICKARITGFVISIAVLAVNDNATVIIVAVILRWWWSNFIDKRPYTVFEHTYTEYDNNC